jgi:hypothetical protein
VPRLTVPSAPFFNYSYSYVFFFYGEIEKKVVFYAERRESEIRRLEGRKEKKSLDFFFSAAAERGRATTEAGERNRTNRRRRRGEGTCASGPPFSLTATARSAAAAGVNPLALLARRGLCAAGRLNLALLRPAPRPTLRGPPGRTVLDRAPEVSADGA